MMELKSCPFCGGKATSHTSRDVDGDGWFHIGCEDCGIFRRGMSGIGEAIKAWNTRHLPSAPKEGK